MSQETNNEIDLLLRRMGRHHDGDLGQHLDVDELSSYAQNALPAAARARYTQHLADCSTCRKLVTELSLSLGATAAAAAPVETVSVPGGLKKFLASLFSPMVLRYAVPALGLIVVAVIGLTVFRRERPGSSSPEMVATSRQAETPAIAGDVKPQSGITHSLEKSGTASPAPEARRGRTEAEPPAAIATPAAAANTPADANKEAPAAKAESTAIATAAPPAAPKPAETSDEDRKQDAGEQKKLAQERPAASPQTERERDFQAGASVGSVASTRRAAKRADSAQDKVAVAPMPLQLGDKASDDAETRTVAGRRFRKQRGIWVDTAYAGGATVDVTRGSEQYRGLVADEPEIKKIAEQLDGQIIVVWKGRTYKIR